MSHEIRTPLNGVLGITESLSMTKLSTEQSEMVGIIQKSGSVLLNVINDILDYSKIEANKIDIEDRLFPAARAFLDLMTLMLPAAEAKGLELKFAGNELGSAVVVGDEYRIKQILGNLISNAIKFTEHGYVHLDIDKRTIEGAEFVV